MARSRSRPEQDQQRGQGQRGDQRKITQLHEPSGTEVYERDRGHEHDTRDNAFREAHEQKIVTYRIRSAEEDSKADRR